MNQHNFPYIHTASDLNLNTMNNSQLSNPYPYIFKGFSFESKSKWRYTQNDYQKAKLIL